ncbi:hypothetical protein CW354_20190 [Marinicaulis flavus]|uniref:DUF1259 domain-containing protein n=2 Tax=Hyphococcus luteus TaxID=2058213 RepID=A0A2S7K0G2_9PROT|nr:hypothetical protein CW354_20190 [Marinicaulis flavus]
MSATVTSDGVVRIGWQRDDAPVRIDGAAFPPAAGLGSWAAFTAVGDHAMLMGDTVVFEDEITPAMDAAFANGLSVTALHNHFIYDDPPVYFMHIGGQGEAEALAKGVKAMWDAIRSVRAAHSAPRRSSGAGEVGTGDLDSAALERILGAAASVNGGVAKFTFAREGVMHGQRIGGSMGLTTWAAFIGDDSAAAVAGDFMMTADEVQPVMRALRRHDVHIVALHNHMIGEEPTSYFLHFWGRGPAQELAAGIRAALDAQKE